MNCPNQKKNLASCNCSYDPCARKGICCQCVSYHRANKELPACFFLPESEKSYDRSVNNFLKDNGK